MLRRWQDGRSVVGVTDLHFRETKFDEVIDTTSLGDLNVLFSQHTPRASQVSIKTPPAQRP